MSSSSSASASPPIYLDHAATTPVHPSAVEAMMPYLTSHFGNPSSSHAYGAEPRRAVAEARRDILRHLIGREGTGDRGDLVVFTGCGTEADNLAIDAALRAHRASDATSTPHVVSTSVEHPAVGNYLAALESRGAITVTRCRAGPHGHATPDDVAAAVRPDTALVSVLYVQNETGTVSPLARIVAAVREAARARGGAGPWVHTDAAQAFGKVPAGAIRRDLADVDAVTVVGHKLGCPKGIG
eukprot:CAMPEP_0194271262 /NCGR_PEP_ID=MMETSP0169-20130528/5099_1 /TAXON_ID=218684 /ORGANISM="Corethron pennatum, Strain L29A3" /LENGTH=240 /DNA_ID=CAMNT_0039013571 /DNA_START=187 /DNA_END=905 /DNA_ORIENTATION=-